MKPGAFEKILNKAKEEGKVVVEYDYTSNKYEYTGYIVDDQPYIVSYLSDEKGRIKPEEATKITKGRRITGGNFFMVNNKENLGIPFFEKDGTDNRDFIKLVETALLELEESKNNKVSSTKEELNVINAELQKMDEEGLELIQHVNDKIKEADETVEVEKEEEQVPGLVPVGAPKREKTLAQIKIENERNLKEIRERRFAGEKLAAEIKNIRDQKAAEANVARTKRDEYYASASKERRANRDVEATLQGAVDLKTKENRILKQNLKDQEKETTKWKKKSDHKKTGLMYGALALAVVFIAGITTATIFAFQSKGKDGPIEENNAKIQAQKDATAAFNKVKDDGILIFENEETVARVARKIPTGVKQSVVNELKNVSYAGIANNALAAYKAAYSEKIGEYLGKAVVSELYTNSYDWLSANVLTFDKDGLLQKDENGPVVKDYAFESVLSAYAPSADDFEIGYEAGFAVQLSKDLSGNEITGPDSKTDEEISTIVNSAAWTNAVKNKLDRLDKDDFKDTTIVNVDLDKQNGVLEVVTANRFYQLKLNTNEDNQIVDANGKLLNVTAESVNDIVDLAEMQGAYKPFKTAVSSLISEDKIQAIYDDYKTANKMTENDNLEIYWDISGGKIVKVDLIYVGTKGGTRFTETKSKNGWQNYGDIVEAPYAVLSVAKDRGLGGFSFLSEKELDKAYESLTNEDRAK